MYLDTDPLHKDLLQGFLCKAVAWRNNVFINIFRISWGSPMKTWHHQVNQIFSSLISRDQITQEYVYDNVWNVNEVINMSKKSFVALQTIYMSTRKDCVIVLRFSTYTKSRERKTSAYLSCFYELLLNFHYIYNKRILDKQSLEHRRPVEMLLWL